MGAEVKRRDREHLRRLFDREYVQATVSLKYNMRSVVLRGLRNVLRLQRFADKHGVRLSQRWPCEAGCEECEAKLRLLEVPGE